MVKRGKRFPLACSIKVVPTVVQLLMVVPEKVPSQMVLVLRAVPVLRVVLVLMVVPTMVSGYTGGAYHGYGVRATVAAGYV